jgi:hypothetical protein
MLLPYWLGFLADCLGRAGACVAVEAVPEIAASTVPFRQAGLSGLCGWRACRYGSQSCDGVVDDLVDELDEFTSGWFQPE